MKLSAHMHGDTCAPQSLSVYLSFTRTDSHSLKIYDELGTKFSCVFQETQLLLLVPTGLMFLRCIHPAFGGLVLSSTVVLSLT